jgi:hypothetical protein
MHTRLPERHTVGGETVRQGGGHRRRGRQAPSIIDVRNPMKVPFLIRSPDRDRRTDVARMTRLRQALLQIGQEVADERTGLERRYLEAEADAAFAQERVEDGLENQALTARVDDLTETMINYSRRIAMLEKQIAYVEQMRKDLEDFAAENELPLAT